MDDLYLDTILDRYKHPLFQRELEENERGVVKHFKTHNPSCGDAFKIHVLVVDDMIADATWSGEGCAISTTSTDFFCEWAVGKKESEIHDFDKTKIRELTGIETITPAREKCLYLPISLKA